MTLNVAACGDSVMWGEGLAPEEKFAFTAAARIAERLGEDVNMSIFTPRCGATIRTRQRDRKVSLSLPSGRTIRVNDGSAAQFYDTYPAFFTSDTEVTEFLDGKRQDIARQLFADLPSSFPNITFQVAEEISDELGESIDILFLNGSANDIDFEEVLKPEGPSIGKVAELVERFAYEAFLRLVRAARAKCPKAVIVIAGYFSPFSSSTNRGQLERMAKYMADRPEWQVAINELFTETPLRFGPTAILLDLFGLTKNVDSLLTRAIARSEYAHALGLFFLRRAVSELNQTNVRGPGLLFVNPSFSPGNALFGDGEPFLHEGYEVPAPGDHDHRREVHDSAFRERTQRMPRFRRLDEMKRVLARHGVLFAGHRVSQAADALRELASTLDGPASLLAAADRLGERLDVGDVREAAGALSRDIGRIEIATIASFLHPNPAGARRYSDAIVERFFRAQHESVGAGLRQFARGGSTSSVSMRETLARFGLDASLGLRACAEHFFVDSVALEIETAPTPAPHGTLHLGEAGSLALKPPPRPSGLFPVLVTRSLYTVDTLGSLRLADITEVTVDLVAGVAGATHDLSEKLRTLTLYINGVRVFTTSGQDSKRMPNGLRFVYPA
jgi:hypothetical protein